MVWCRPGEKSLSKKMMISLLTHICVTRAQWVERVVSERVLPINLMSAYFVMSYLFVLGQKWPNKDIQINMSTSLRYCFQYTVICVNKFISIFEFIFIFSKWMSQKIFGDKSTLVQVRAWCRQATSHYLSQRWPRSIPSYGVTMPKWVKLRYPSDYPRVADFHHTTLSVKRYQIFLSFDIINLSTQ